MISNISGAEYMGDNVRDKLRKCGVGVKINPLSKICKPEVIELGDYCRICDFVFIWGGASIRIGKHSDIQAHSFIGGDGGALIGDYVSMGPGAILLSAVYSYKEGLRMVDGLPEGMTHELCGKLVIENDVYIGALCTLMPNITIGEGAVIGANSFVNRDIEPWSINVGSPSRKIGERPKILVENL